MDKEKTAAFELLQSGMFLSLTTHLPIWKGLEEKGELILPIVQSDAQNRVSIAVKMSHISNSLWLIFVILDFFILCLVAGYFKASKQEINNKTKKYVVVGHEAYVYYKHMYYEKAKCKSLLISVP